MDKKVSDAGTLYSFSLFGRMVYMFSSNKGSYRGGKRRNQNKKMIMLFGRARSITHVDDLTVEEKIVGPALLTIEKQIPHLIEFYSYSWVIEWWKEPYTEEKFKPFYEMKK